jgi:predicted regulator of Ras-like GTPase activity (Roadblock/LC7/MglB family)
LASTEEGFPLATKLRGAYDSEALAAAAATIARSSVPVLARLGRGELEVAILEASRLSLLVRRVSPGYLLVVAEPEANLGLIAGEMERASRELEHAAADLLHA